MKYKFKLTTITNPEALTAEACAERRATMKQVIEAPGDVTIEIDKRNDVHIYAGEASYHFNEFGLERIELSAYEYGLTPESIRQSFRPDWICGYLAAMSNGWELRARTIAGAWIMWCVGNQNGPLVEAVEVK